LQTATSVNAATLEERGAVVDDKGGPNLGDLVGALVLFLTVVVVVALGILSGLGAVLLILQAFAPNNSTTNSVTPSLVRNQAHAAHAGGN
jgi:hypothetical protein